MSDLTVLYLLTSLWRRSVKPQLEYIYCTHVRAPAKIVPNWSIQDSIPQHCHVYGMKS